MGDLSTANLAPGGAGGKRCRCPCGAWYPLIGDELPGLWVWHEERVAAFAIRCKRCSRKIASRAVYDSRESSASPAVPAAQRPASPAPVSQDPPNPQTAFTRVRRRRSDVPLPKGDTP